MPRAWAILAAFVAASGAARAGDPAAAPDVPGGAPATAAAPAPDDDRALKEQLSGLKERLSRGRLRPGALQQALEPEGPRAVIVQLNGIGPAFRLESVSYAIDGAPVYAKVDVDGDLAGRRELEVWSGRLPPGDHALSVKLVYRGLAEGLSRYYEGYRFQLEARQAFGAAAGRTAVVWVEAYERDPLAALPERPAVRVRVEAAPEAPGTAPGAGAGAAR